MIKNRVIIFIFLVFLNSCTITESKYKTSNEMKILKDILHSVSTNPIYTREQMLHNSSKKNTRDYVYKFKYNKLKNYESKNTILDNVYFKVFKNKENKDLSKTKLIYFIHGGAFYNPLVKRYPETMDYILNKLDNKPDVYMIDYSVYPAKFPDSHNDVLKGYLELLKLGYLPKNIIFIGDSSGGHLIVSNIHKMISENITLPYALILLSPWLDIQNKGESRILNLTNDIYLGNTYSNEKIDKEIENPYYFKESNEESIFVNPLNGKFDKFPYTYIQVDKTELLYSDSKDLNDKLLKDGAKTKMDVFYGTFHNFQFRNKNIPETKEALSKIINQIDLIFREKNDE